MAQRKCGFCSEPGHTRRTCKVEQERGDAYADSVLDRLASVTRQDPSWQETGKPEEEPAHTYAEDVFADPAAGAGSYGPVIASFDSECAECDGAIMGGDAIHPDGSGEWNCDQCHRILTEVANVHVHTFTWTDDGNGHEGSYCECGAMDTGAEKLARHRAATTLPADGNTAARYEDEPVFADPVTFEDPAPAAPKREQTNRNGYLAKDPTLGDFRRHKNGNIKPITRMTTLIKAGSDRTALTAWNERNVLMGAAHRPDVLERVRALHPNPQGPLPEEKDTKRALDALVDEVAQHVGSKRAADRGTAIHNSVEKVGKGRATLDEIPTDHVPWVKAFLRCLEVNGLELVPDMIECTVYLPQFGGIMGRFDLAVRHRASGRMLMADVKTGELDYAWHEIQGQLAGYTAAYAQHGTYEWNWSDPSGESDRWVPPVHTLDATEGIVFHLPVKSGVPGCHPKRVDLRAGWEHLEECGRMREHLKKRPKPQPWTEPEPPAGECAWIPGHAGPACDWSRDCPVHGEPEPPAAEPELQYVGGCTCDPGPEGQHQAHCGYAPADDGQPEDRDWVSEFAQARDKTHLAGLYESAASVLGPGEKLDYLVATGQARLRALAALETARAVLGEASDEPPF